MGSTANLGLIVVAAGFALAFVFGLTAARTNFCTMGALSDVVNMGSWTRMRTWMLAVAVALLGTALLSLPLATSEGSRASLLDALFTATSAVCVTGHIVVDTSTYWSGFGQVVILALIQLGGFGFMTSSADSTFSPAPSSAS